MTDTSKTEYLANGTPVCITAQHRFGTDAMLLSAFCGVHRDWSACDLGSGCGIIPLRWHDMGHRGRCVGVELSPEGTALLGQAAAAMPHITAVCADLRTLEPCGNFDLVSCNPPYFTGGRLSEKPNRATARHEVTCAAADVACAAAKLLRDGGRLCICNRPERLADYIVASRLAGLEPKRLRFVRSRRDAVPWLFLLDCRKAGRSGLHLEADLITENDTGGCSDELLQIYGKQPPKAFPPKQ
ncbi:MAG: methyltransferase domain-containing protein [Pygmaiobacter sp.]